MTDKAYIVANKQQEFEVLNELEQKGLLWGSTENPTEWITSKSGIFKFSIGFPYALIERKSVSWSSINQLTDETIVYDGRKEDEMNNKYKVTQKFINELIKWRDDERLNINTKGMIGSFLDIHHIKKLPDLVDMWWTVLENKIENNNRLIAIVKWLNGEDVFEVEEPNKFIVCSDVTDEDGDYWYVVMHREISSVWYHLENDTRFNTREEAQEWANSHQVVVEIDAEGNEVE